MKLQQEPKRHGGARIGAGALKKDFFEHLVQFRVSVKRKHYNEAQIKINELLKQYR